MLDANGCCLHVIQTPNGDKMLVFNAAGISLCDDVEMRMVGSVDTGGELIEGPQRMLVGSSCTW